MKKILIVVDMINGFIYEGNLHDKEIAKIIPACVSHVESYLDAGYPVVAFIDCHDEKSREFTAFPPHCLKGSQEGELVDELAIYEERMKLIRKNSTNGIFAPEFQPILSDLGDYDEILIVGCCSDICVLQLALSLRTYCNQHNLKTEIIVDELACDTFDIPGHQREKYNETAFDLLRNSGVKVVRGG